MNKYTIHVPTVQYGFLEVNIEGSASDAVMAHKELQEAYAGKAGLSEPEFQKVLDRYLWSEAGDMDSEDYAAMSSEQITIIQNVKRSKARQNYNLNKNK